MGNDGGSIPDRRDLVKTKAKAEQADKANQTKARWFYCALSKKRLQEPVVSCLLGKLYNKDAIIEYLLDKSAYGDGEEICGHIRSLKDVKPLKLTPNGALSNGNGDDENRASFVCSLTQKEMNGVQPFVCIYTCGCVFSQAGLRTVAGSPKEKEKQSESGGDSPTPPAEESLDLCPQCGTKYSRTADIIPLNPEEEEEMVLRAAMGQRRALEPSKKKSKKRKQLEEAGDTAEPPSKKKHGFSTSQPSINPAMGAASKAVIQGLAEEEAKRKAGMSAAVKSLYGDGKPARKETFMTMGTFTRYA